MAEEEKEREEKAPVGDQKKEEEKGGGLNAHFKKHWYLYAAGFGAAVLVISIISLKAKANQAQNAGTTDPTANGYVGHVDTMAGGFPDTSNYDSVMSMLNGLNSAEAQNYTLLGQLAKGQTPTQPAPTTSDPSTQTNLLQTWTAAIRQRFSGGTDAYDKAIAQGVPIHASPDPSSKTIGYLPYGSTGTFVGTPVTGANNFKPGATTGSNLWEKTTSGGYVSTYDIRG